MILRPSNIDEFLYGIKNENKEYINLLKETNEPLNFEIDEYYIKCRDFMHNYTSNLYEKMLYIASFTNNVMGVGCTFTIE